MTSHNRGQAMSPSAFVILHLALLICATAFAALPSPPPASAPGNADASVPPNVQASVDKALRWLADHQKKESGTWASPIGDRPAINGLVIMAFLSRGHTPGQGPYGEQVNKAIDFILRFPPQPNGMIGPTMYDHGIATVMLCEVYGMVDEDRRKLMDPMIAKSVKLILDAQKRTQGTHAGGWHYTPTQIDADISCTGWQLMALRGAANCGANVPKTAIEAGMAYIKRNAVRGGGFGYMGPSDPNPSRTGTGILSLELLGEHNTKEAIAGGDFLIRVPPTNPSDPFYYYAVYYCSQSLNQLGGKYWEQVYPRLRDTLLARQQAQGSFPPGQGAEAQGGEPYATSMAVLALGVPYRYLPLYQK